MLRTQQKLDEMLGYHYPMQVMRPPFGSTSERGYECVTVSELLGFDAAAPSEGIYIYEEEHAVDPALLR